MKVRVDTDGTNIITIHQGESEPTGVVMNGTIQIAEGDILINADAKTTKMFNGTSWVLWRTES